jgi:hypothetical protein
MSWTAGNATGVAGRAGASAGIPMPGASDNVPAIRSDIEAQADRLAAASKAANTMVRRGTRAALGDADLPGRADAEPHCFIDPNPSTPAPDPAMLGANREIGVNSMN